MAPPPKKQESPLFGGENTEKVLTEAQRIVQMAVGVLEEEVAAGIFAAKKIENKFVDVDRLRNRDPEDLMSKVRKDAHDILDIFIDFLAVASEKMSLIKNDIISSEHTNIAASDQHLTVIKNDRTVNPGDRFEIPISITNDNGEQNKTIQFSKGDLVGNGETKINSRNIDISPSSLSVESNETKVAIISIKLPKRTVPGKYIGVFFCKKDVSTRMVLEIEVKENGSR